MIAAEDAGIVVIGSGVAGLTTALTLQPWPVTLLTKTAGLPGGSSPMAQGGIAAAVGAGDTAAAHAADTLAAGVGLVDAGMAALLAAEGIDAVHALIRAGLPVDRATDGALLLGREAAHGHDRIVHAGGDATGRTLIETLAARVAASPSIAVRTRAVAAELVVREGRVCGVLAHHPEGWRFHRASRVVLATGGIGAAFARTTNPPEATGDGLALAARAGAELADLEFVQFHPTALATDSDPAPLLTEALRGAGALLLDDAGHRFMADEHPLAELAPRDVVARAIHRRVVAGEAVYLDARPALAAKPQGFPTVAALAAAAGFDAWAEPLPVAPAAHYHMGGVRTDRDGRTSLPGLWACGEVAATGVHGANRLASNSLLEGLVFGARVARDVAAGERTVPPEVKGLRVPAVATGDRVAAIAADGRRTLYRHAGITRDAAGLAEAAGRLRRLAEEVEAMALSTLGMEADAIRTGIEADNRLLVARLIVHAAAGRAESRGAHHRTDAPHTSAMPRHSLLTIDALHRELAGVPPC